MFRRSMCLILILLLGTFFVQAGQDNVLFEDNFEEDKDLTQWDYGNEDIARVITDGENRVLRLRSEEGGITIYSLEGDDWTNYALELRAKVVTPAEGNNTIDVVLIARYDADSGNSSGAWISTDEQQAVVASIFDEELQLWAEIPHDLETDEWYDLRLVVVGEHIEFSINGEVVAEVDTPEQGTQGVIGIGTGSFVEVWIDDVVVTALEGDDENDGITVDADIIDAIIGDEGDDSEGGDDDEAAELEVVATVEVVVQSANLRSGTGTGFAIVGSARRGDQFGVLASSGSGDQTWYLLDADVETWIWSGTVEIIEQEDEIPDISEGTDFTHPPVILSIESEGDCDDVTMYVEWVDPDGDAAEIQWWETPEGPVFHSEELSGGGDTSSFGGWFCREDECTSYVVIVDEAGNYSNVVEFYTECR